jgi:hypothetical protein
MKRSKKSILLSLAILLLIVVVFPLISLKYLNEGLAFRQDQLELLEDLGEIKDFKAGNIDGKTMSKDMTLGRITVISYDKQACQSEEAITLKEYVDKFINQDDFRHVILKHSSECANWGESYLADYDENMELVNQIDQLISSSNQVSHVALVDRKGQIRHIYDLTQKDDIESLVTHTTLLMPPLKKRG